LVIALSRTEEISIHAPREGSDRCYFNPLKSRKGFQSTLPVRGATGGANSFLLAPRDISIHAPREGSDRAGALPCDFKIIFQSTLPVRGATGF